MTVSDDLGAEQDRLGDILTWLAQRMLPYAFAMAGEAAPETAIGAELTAPDGDEIWRLGPPGARALRLLRSYAV